MIRALAWLWHAIAYVISGYTADERRRWFANRS